MRTEIIPHVSSPLLSNRPLPRGTAEGPSPKTLLPRSQQSVRSFFSDGTLALTMEDFTDVWGGPWLINFPAIHCYPWLSMANPWTLRDMANACRSSAVLQDRPVAIRWFCSTKTPCKKCVKKRWWFILSFMCIWRVQRGAATTRQVVLRITFPFWLVNIGSVWKYSSIVSYIPSFLSFWYPHFLSVNAQSPR